MGTLATNEIVAGSARPQQGATQPTRDIGRRFPASLMAVHVAATARRGGAPVNRGARGLTAVDNRRRVVGADPFEESSPHAS